MSNRKGQHAEALQGIACRTQSKGLSVLDWGQEELSGIVAPAVMQDLPP